MYGSIMIFFSLSVSSLALLQYCCELVIRVLWRRK
uniref:Uncharacterized protein n=1 Tax=Rhizophora mucronata TaxID=61149 RepID=A0A2P2PDE6_RHIMU